MSKKIKITVQNLRSIYTLCKELGIDCEQYDVVDDTLAGKLIFDLSRIKLFHSDDLRNNRMSAPDPHDYMRGGKYDRNKG